MGNTSSISKNVSNDTYIVVHISKYRGLSTSEQFNSMIFLNTFKVTTFPTNYIKYDNKYEKYILESNISDIMRVSESIGKHSLDTELQFIIENNKISEIYYSSDGFQHKMN